MQVISRVWLKFISEFLGFGGKHRPKKNKYICRGAHENNEIGGQYNSGVEFHAESKL